MSDDWKRGPDQDVAAQIIRERNATSAKAAPAAPPVSAQPPAEATPSAAMEDAWRHAGLLHWIVTIYAVLGILGSFVLIVNDESTRVLGFAGLLSTALTAGCAMALVHGLRVLIVICERLPVRS